MTSFAEAEEQRVLLEQTAANFVLLDIPDQSLDRAHRCIPDLARGFWTVAADQLVQLQFAVGREKTRAAARRTAADDVLVDEYDLESLAQELGRGARAGEAGADDDHVALDVLPERWAVPVLRHQQRREPPVLIDHAHGCLARVVRTCRCSLCSCTRVSALGAVRPARIDCADVEQEGNRLNSPGSSDAAHQRRGSLFVIAAPSGAG